MFRETKISKWDLKNKKFNIISTRFRQRSVIMQGLRPNSPRKFAFTLAKVLITLGIIGVVAAMTMPSLMANYQEKATVTRLKKAYSIISQAYLRAQEEYGSINVWGFTEDADNPLNPDTGEYEWNEAGTTNMGIFWSKILPYLNFPKVCASGDNNCKKYDKVTNLHGADMTSTYIKMQTVTLNDGITFIGGWINNYNCNDKTYCGDIAVDINGITTPPNTTGRDIFTFWIYNKRIIPMGNTNETYRTFSEYCNRNSSENGNGYGCSAWVIYNENMDYLHCDDLSWDGKKKCK